MLSTASGFFDYTISLDVTQFGNQYAEGSMTVDNGGGPHAAAFAVRAYNVVEGGDVQVEAAAWDATGHYGTSDFEFWTEDDSAVSGGGYASASGSFSLSVFGVNGSYNGFTPVATIPTYDDTVAMGNRSFSIHIRPVDQPEGEIIIHPTIYDDDRRASFEAEAAPTTEGNAMHLAVTVDDTGWNEIGLFSPRNVSVWTEDGTAVNGIDYEFGASSPSYAEVLGIQGFPETRSVALDIPTNDDHILNGTRSFTIHLTFTGSGVRFTGEVT